MPKDTTKKTATKKAASVDDDEDEDDEPAPKKSSKKVADDDEDDEEEVKPKKKKAQAEDDEDEDEDEEPAPKKKKAAAEDDDDDDSDEDDDADDDEDEEPKKKSKKSSDDEDDDDAEAETGSVTDPYSGKILPAKTHTLTCVQVRPVVFKNEEGTLFDSGVEYTFQGEGKLADCDSVSVIFWGVLQRPEGLDMKKRMARKLADSRKAVYFPEGPYSRDAKTKQLLNMDKTTKAVGKEFKVAISHYKNKQGEAVAQIDSIARAD
jgi:hypothetical protein